MLGSGSFGTVFKGLRRGFQEVAVKKLACGTAEDAWLRLLSKEVQILKKVSLDRNIVQFYGACLRSQQSAMLVMEYMEVRPIVLYLFLFTYGTPFARNTFLLPQRLHTLRL